MNISSGSETDQRRVGWICTYVPEELIHAAGFQPVRLLPGYAGNEKDVDDLLPASICPFIRQVLGSIRSEIYDNLEGIVVAQSCNGMMHLYNALQAEFKGFVYLLDIPRKKDREAVSYFTGELDMFLAELENRNGPVNNETLTASLNLYGRRTSLIHELLDKYDGSLNKFHHSGPYGMAEEAASLPPSAFIDKAETFLENTAEDQPGQKSGRPALLLSGGVPSQGLVGMLSSVTDLKLYPETCTGLRYLLRPPIDHADPEERDRNKILELIAHNYLTKPPCPRLLDAPARKNYYQKLIENLNIKAAVYHDLMFCDLCHYDYLILKEVPEQKNVPCLKVKTGLGHEDSGQLQTRVEAFLEIIQ